MNKKEFTSNNITELKHNEIFVFGSNTEGRHGKGAALIAIQKFGAVYGNPCGLQGNSYAIITKELRKDMPFISLLMIATQIWMLILFAQGRPGLKFYVTKIGCNLAGYKVEDIANIFKILDRNVYGPIPNNIILPKEFII